MGLRTVSTLQVKDKESGETRVINASDFDETKHTKEGEATAPVGVIGTLGGLQPHPPAAITLDMIDPGDGSRIPRNPGSGVADIIEGTPEARGLPAGTVIKAAPAGTHIGGRTVAGGGKLAGEEGATSGKAGATPQHSEEAEAAIEEQREKASNFVEGLKAAQRIPPVPGKDLLAPPTEEVPPGGEIPPPADAARRKKAEEDAARKKREDDAARAAGAR